MAEMRSCEDAMAEMRSCEDAIAEKSNMLDSMESRLDGSISNYTQIFGELHDQRIAVNLQI